MYEFPESFHSFMTFSTIKKYAIKTPYTVSTIQISVLV